MIRVLFFALVALTTITTPAHALRYVDGQYVFDKFKDYERCQGEDETGVYCLDALDNWLEAHPEDRWKAARKVRLSMNSWVAVPYFYAAQDHADWNCVDEQLHLAVIHGLSVPESHDEVIGQSRHLAFEACFDALKDQLVAGLDNSYLFANSCDLLDGKGLLPAERQSECAAMQPDEPVAAE